MDLGNRPDSAFHFVHKVDDILDFISINITPPGAERTQHQTALAIVFFNLVKSC